jgi:membrane-associated phospholipid phosphatase
METTAGSRGLSRQTTRTDALDVPVLRARRGGVAETAALAFGRRGHPVLVFAVIVVCGLVVLTGLSVGAAYLLTHVLGHQPAVASANRHVDRWLAANRTPGLTEASLIGSIMAGGVVLPSIAGLVAATCAVLRRWQLAAYAVFALALESGAYRGTTLLFHEHRPRVHRLEQLPVDASYPSGHTAASIAVYGGLVLLLTSRFRSPLLRGLAWTVAVLIPFYVAFSRMYRGMHYPLDTLGGALLGLAALFVIVFACRAADAAAGIRARAR